MCDAMPTWGEGPWDRWNRSRLEDELTATLQVVPPRRRKALLFAQAGCLIGGVVFTFAFEASFLPGPSSNACAPGSTYASPIGDPSLWLVSGLLLQLGVLVSAVVIRRRGRSAPLRSYTAVYALFFLALLGWMTSTPALSVYCVAPWLSDMEALVVVGGLLLLMALPVLAFSMDSRWEPEPEHALEPVSDLSDRIHD